MDKQGERQYKKGSIERLLPSVIPLEIKEIDDEVVVNAVLKESKGHPFTIH